MNSAVTAVILPEKECHVVRVNKFDDLQDVIEVVNCETGNADLELVSAGGSPVKNMEIRVSDIYNYNNIPHHHPVTMEFRRTIFNPSCWCCSTLRRVFRCERK